MDVKCSGVWSTCVRAWGTAQPAQPQAVFNNQSLVSALQAADEEGKGFILQHMLQHVLMVRFGILLGAVELECLKAEW